MKIERILYLLANPETKEKTFCSLFECRKRIYYRDKAYIRDHLWNYEVKMLKWDEIKEKIK